MPIRIGVLGYTRKLTDFIPFLTGAMSITILVNISTVTAKKQAGLKVFKAIKSLLTAKDVNLKTSQLNKLIKLNSNLVICYNRLWWATVWSCSLVILTPLFLFRQPSIEQLSLMIASQIIIYPVMIIITKIIMPPLVHLFIVSRYFQLRIRRQKILSCFVETFSGSSRNSLFLLNLLNSHNALCRDIAAYNLFWNPFYFFTLLFMVPFNLFALHCLLFGKLATFLIFGYVAAFLISAVYVFAIGSFFADISYQISKSRKQVLHILDNYKLNLDTSTWLKAMDCLERVRSRKVGFTCGPLFFVTYTTVFKVSFKVRYMYNNDKCITMICIKRKYKCIIVYFIIF